MPNLYNKLTAVLLCLPKEIKGMEAPLCAYSDPAVVGMFFTGAQLMLEKSQGGFLFCHPTFRLCERSLQSQGKKS